ncbi:MAG TPA: GNAT family protein [Allosphingosinicella sp.]|jgi:RimJ/RimL family protein N-acetyltransferase|uniref:GNAT family N-acetyltransferase n=1 Tax=Allosphingosinicella sp. TaxID=2823234 RepID=UPI002F27529C
MIFATSERLILRRAREEDLEPLLVSWSEPAMTRYTGVKPDVRGFLTGMIADMQVKAPGETDPGGPWYQFIVERRSDGAMVGDLGVGFGLPGERQVELGYRIHPAHHRQGYGREAVTAIIDWLIDAHSIHRFVGVAAAENAASIALLRALGFRQEGYFRQSFWCNRAWLDDCYFAVLASEWLDRR